MFHTNKVVEETITMAKAEQMLMNELGYTKDRAHVIIKHLDKSGDGKLSGKELERFKQSIKQSKKELTDAFVALDQQHVGYITIDMAKNFLQRDPFSFPLEKCTALLSKFDKDGNGKLYYNEFITFYVEAKETYQTISSYFQQLDADGNGYLSPDELLVAIMNSTGLEESFARDFIAQFDTDGNGSIDKAEFMTMWTLMFG